MIEGEQLKMTNIMKQQKEDVTQEHELIINKAQGRINDLLNEIEVVQKTINKTWDSCEKLRLDFSAMNSNIEFGKVRTTKNLKTIEEI